jgi:UDP-N-acetyl-D-glucosamine dehydrogenase
VLTLQDCVLIATDHSCLDYSFIGQHAKLVVDTRNAMARLENPKAAVIKA